MHDYPALQILALLIQSVIMQILFIKGKPMHNALENKLCIFNEVMVSWYLILLMPLAGVQSSVDFLMQSGLALVAIILFTFFVNILAFLYFVAQGGLEYCKRKGTCGYDRDRVVVLRPTQGRPEVSEVHETRARVTA